MIALRKSARIVLLTGMLAAPGLALAEGAPPAAPKTGESVKAGEKKAEAKAHKKGAKAGDKDKTEDKGAHAQH